MVCIPIFIISKKLKYNYFDQCLFIIQMDVEDTFWNIVKYIPMKHILQLQLLSKQHQQWVHNMPYSIRRERYLRLHNLASSVLSTIIRKYQLININLNYSGIRDDDCRCLDSCETINSYKCYNVTNDFAQHITNCKSLFLSSNCGTPLLQHLTNIQDLYLNHCKQINNNSVKYISHCRRLDITGTNITEEMLPHFVNCYGLVIGKMKISSPSNIKHLKCQIIDLAYTNVDDTIIQYLVGRRIINLHGTNITGKNLDQLKSSQAVNVSRSICVANQPNIYQFRCPLEVVTSYNYYQTLFLRLMYSIHPDFYNYI